LLGDGYPFDQRAAGTDLSYADMTTPSGLADIAGYAAAIGPDKDHYPLRQAGSDAMPEPSALLQVAHSVGLEVHPYTFRADMPSGAMPIGTPQQNEGNGMRAFELELARLLQAGIDGFFIDQPDIGVRVRAAALAMHEQRPERPSGV
jgi:glycerophosphoryl diester phosphodiesterase